MGEVSNFISSVGFPIAMCCGFAYVLWHMWKTIKSTCDTLTLTNSELAKTNNELVSTINRKIDTMKDTLDELVEKRE